MHTGDHAGAWRDLVRLARANARGGWAFREWMHGKTLAAGGMRGQSWNAAAFLMAHNAVTGGAPLFQRLASREVAAPIQS
jgi:hypothetical protein